MIILDTCIVDSFRLNSVSTDLLKTIRTSKVEQVAVPQTVMEELVSHRAVPYREKHRKVVEALDRFGKSTPWPAPPTPIPQLGIGVFEAHWKSQYYEFADVLPASPEVLQEAFYRESNVLPPCKAVVTSEGGDTVKTGGRDAAIWLTAVEYARQHPEETVYFVSRNTADFGDGTTYPEAMRQDLDLNGVADRFVHLTTLAQVVERFTTETAVDDAMVESTLRDAETLQYVADVAFSRQGFLRDGLKRRSSIFECTKLVDVENFGSDGVFESTTLSARGWLTSPKAQFSTVRDVKAYRIGDHVWCMATVRWLLAGIVIPGEDVTPTTVGVAWETRVLLSTTQPKSRPTVLRTSPPKLAAATEFDFFPDVPRMPPGNLTRAERLAAESLLHKNNRFGYLTEVIRSALSRENSVTTDEILQRMVAKTLLEQAPDEDPPEA
ncbi:PIN domain-containing protein [Streptomyces sp. ME02-6987-2C]|uniref:PIN domain-containing protein n=1 Tax=unclassified Streptomyces TaxID=2593676 RepID=UPI0029A9F846|nr:MULTISPECIES: PIN domain-containing protein [unclassified Streptomyces]MDX3345904.1 PIN domain-containing protein [Streptomyces sp. ME02-6979A]MDX3365098.1 PIN domain-containing protein [Streptomyces sp. ME02-6987-2C]MDX3404846.1 PIN domain-containing protein [Streptomyces sp. ME02-6977A]MDX3421670.1 PIN domain-containing protein [Streptomyces sp. ME02-6985-2c]